MEKRRFTYKEALVLTALIALTAVLYIVLQPRGAGSTAVIEQNGAEVARVALSALSESEEFEVNGAVITCSRDGARFVSSPCPDHICVNAGLLTRAGEAAVCLPQRVSVRLVGQDGLDGITG